MPSTGKYSIWLIPRGAVYHKLDHLISLLSKSYRTPNFEPHVTLIGGVTGSENEILEKTAQLASLLRLFQIKLTQVNHFDEYFRCLFVRVEEVKPIVEANAKAREIFGKKDDLEYLPHLSLVYGNLTPETKEEIIAKIGRKFDLRFEVKSFSLFSTQGEVKDWYIVKEFPLK